MRSFLNEALTMRDFRHDHVLRLIGIVIDADRMPLVILPFMSHGDLLSYIRDDQNVSRLSHLTCQSFRHTTHVKPLQTITIPGDLSVSQLHKHGHSCCLSVCHRIIGKRVDEFPWIFRRSGGGTKLTDYNLGVRLICVPYFLKMVQGIRPCMAFIFRNWVFKNLSFWVLTSPLHR